MNTTEEFMSLLIDWEKCPWCWEWIIEGGVCNNPICRYWEDSTYTLKVNTTARVNQALLEKGLIVRFWRKWLDELSLNWYTAISWIFEKDSLKLTYVYYEENKEKKWCVYLRWERLYPTPIIIWNFSNFVAFARQAERLLKRYQNQNSCKF
jgi:hypothetical protein